MGQRLTSKPTASERTLLLCRTPFQAKFMEKLVRNKNLSADLLYVTETDSPEDRLYAGHLADRCGKADYIVIKNRGYLLTQLVQLFSMRNQLDTKVYSKIVLASLDDLVFRRIARKSHWCSIVTIDDGAENILENPFKAKGGVSRRESFYSRAFAAGSVKELVTRVDKHFTAFEDIVPKLFPRDTTEYVRVFDFPKMNSVEMGPVFFIGQPFREALSEEQVDRVRVVLRDLRVDYYVKHPREDHPMIDDVRVLPKENKLAEDAIIDVSGSSRPTIIAAFSTVLFTVSSSFARKIYIDVVGSYGREDRRDLARAAGCELLEV